METIEEKKTEMVGFRVTPAVKMKLASRATALQLGLSEYLQAALLDYEDVQAKAHQAQQESQHLQRENKGLLEQARELTGQALTADRVKQIRQEAVRDFQQMQSQKGLKSPYIEVNKDLKRRVESYETLPLKVLFEQVRGQVACLGARRVPINDLPDLVAVLVAVYEAQEVEKVGTESAKGGAQ